MAVCSYLSGNANDEHMTASFQLVWIEFSSSYLSDSGISVSQCQGMPGIAQRNPNQMTLLCLCFPQTVFDLTV